MPCHWTKDGDGNPVMIPECYGGANDPEHCTCNITGSELDKLREALREAEERIERMRAATQRFNERYAQVFNHNRALRARILELEAQPVR